MKRICFIRIGKGVASGEIDDGLVAQEFRKLRPPYRYRPEISLASGLFDVSGLLLGDTPVTEFEGLRYPLQTVGSAISRIPRRGLPVDAIAGRPVAMRDARRDSPVVDRPVGGSPRGPV